MEPQKNAADNDACHVVGAACWYGGAPDLRTFWQNILAQRAGFRRIVPSRLSLSDYGADGATPADAADRTYVARAALIDGFEFDWRKRRIPRAAYAATDLAHWLALDVALAAAAHAGIDWARLDRQRVAVIVGNSLTGEISRANGLRLRWPFARRAMAQALTEAGVDEAARRAAIGAAEKLFKGPFPEPNEDSLAGSLSNVIAGRIANFLDLHGGGFSVDGACASSLLAVELACDGIAAGRWDLAIAGGVDISLDPMELVGFARVGAMTRGTMRVYDERSGGFLPGEGAGFVVLESAGSAARHGRRALAVVRGWGMSSDGSGGITAPGTDGQAAALRRAYDQAGYPLGTVHFVEGHGTGTPLGDKVELSALGEVAGPLAAGTPRSIGMTSVKALLGHTKAAAGVAGFIKTVLAVNQRVLPPLPRFERPNEVLARHGCALYPLTSGEVLAADAEMRAGVSSAGFGGINCHVALSSPAAPPLDLGGPSSARLLASHQGAELLVARGPSRAELDVTIVTLQRATEHLADGELADFCAAAARRASRGDWRMALVAVDAEDLAGKLERARVALQSTFEGVREFDGGEIVLGFAGAPPRVGFLFPGQGAQFLGMGGRLPGRFDWAAARLARWDAAFADGGCAGLRERIARPVARAADEDMLAAWRGDLRDTRWAQPAVAATALNWADWLGWLGVVPAAVAGHSLGELPALLLAGALDEAELIEILKVRSRAAAAADVPGVMANLACGPDRAGAWVAAAPGYCVLANLNAPDATVVAGEPLSVAAVERAAAQAGVRSVRLEVSNAFHSRYMEPAAAALAALADRLGGTRPLRLPFVSALEARALDERIDLIGYAAAQVLAPVRYTEAVARLGELCDLFVELGPGQIQTGLVRRILGAQKPTFALEPAAADADRALCVALGQLFVRGVPLRLEAIFEGRLIRPFVPAHERKFIANPCETLALRDLGGWNAAAATGDAAEPASTPVAAQGQVPAPAAADDALALVRRIVAETTGYEDTDIEADSRLGRDLNLDSIKIAEVGASIARLGWIAMPPLEMQRATVSEVAASMRREGLAGDDGSIGAGPQPAAAATAPLAVPELAVSAFATTWSPLEAEDTAGSAQPLHLLFDVRQSAAALELSAAFAAAGRTCALLPWRRREPVPTLPVGIDRLAVLVPRVAATQEPTLAEDLAGYLLAMAGLLSAGVDELIVVSVHEDDGEATLDVDGLGAAATVLLEGLARHVRVVRLAGAGADLDLDLRALRAPPREALEYLRIDRDGRCERARLERLADEVLQPSAPLPLADGDTLLATGGLRGITAECLLALAGRRRLKMVVVGRSDPQALDDEARNNLRRLRERCVEVAYVGADVADPEALRAALTPVLTALGSVRGIVHGAGLNAAASLGRIDAAAVAREIGIKAGGLANLLGLVDPSELRLCVGLGSIIAVIGMHGNAAYALANELLGAQLAQLKRAWPQIVVACPAFSVWREVGMGAKLASPALNAVLGAAGIDPAVGTAAFLACVARGTPERPFVVAPPPTGLSTWRHLRSTHVPVAARFLTPLVFFEPEIALVARPELSHQSDSYLEHHRFDGTPLFPTVFALKAFLSAAVALRAVAAGAAATISDITLTRPIVVEDGGARTIEVAALRAGDGSGVRVVVGEPGRAFAEPVFAGLVRAAAPTPVELPEIGGETPAADLSDHLYRGLLFQGRPFQRIARVVRLDRSDPDRPAGEFEILRAPNPAFVHLADPYFVDALLQTVQVLVPQDVCLPRALARVTVTPALWRGGAARVVARVVERTADGYLCEAIAMDSADGTLVARLEGYDVGIVEHRAERPGLEALLDPLAEDRARLEAALGRLRSAGLPPAIRLAADTAPADEPQTVRRARAQALASALAGTLARLEWDADGRPRLADAPEAGVSISHAGGRIVVVCGTVGCDLERVERRPRAEWAAMLPPAFGELAAALVKRSFGPDAAATLAWTAHECALKAGLRGAVPRLAGGGEGVATIDLAAGGAHGGRVYATLVDLALAGRSALAVLAPAVETAASASVAPIEQVFRHQFRPSFRDVTTPRRTVAAHTFFGWIGQARELAMASIHVPLAEAFAPERGHAMVTNFSEVELYAPVGFGCELEVVVWLDRMVEAQPSTFELGFLWRRTDDETGTALAAARQRLTWVRVNDAGLFRPEPFPDFFADFLAARHLAPAALPAQVGATATSFHRFADERRWRKGDNDEAPVQPLTTTFETDLSHSNFVANVYFSHYGTMFERAVLRMLARGPDRGGWESLALSGLRVDHLGEARPGDSLQVEVEVESIGAASVTASGRFVNSTHGGAPIAAARARLRPMSSGPTGTPRWDPVLAAGPAPRSQARRVANG